MVAHPHADQFAGDDAWSLPAFARRAGDALWLDELVRRFSDAARKQGAVGHGCFDCSGGDRVLLFGADGDERGGEVIRFPLEGWDQRPYEIEMTLAPEAASPGTRANLHAMAAIYLARGLALLDAFDEPRREALTEREIFCRDHYAQGRSGIDIAEDLDTSAEAVMVYLERAARKSRDQSGLVVPRPHE